MPFSGSNTFAKPVETFALTERTFGFIIKVITCFIKYSVELLFQNKKYIYCTIYTELEKKGRKTMKRDRPMSIHTTSPSPRTGAPEKENKKTPELAGGDLAIIEDKRYSIAVDYLSKLSSKDLRRLAALVEQLENPHT